MSFFCLILEYFLLFRLFSKQKCSTHLIYFDRLMGTDYAQSIKYQCISKYTAPGLISFINVSLPGAGFWGCFWIHPPYTPARGQHRVSISRAAAVWSCREINSLDRIASQEPEISTLSSLLHPTNPELWEGLYIEQIHKSKPQVRWLMRDGREKYNKLFDPWPFAHCYCSGLCAAETNQVQQL